MSTRTPRTAAREYPDIGGQLRAARRERRLSIRELAKRLEVSPSLISQIETGRAQPSVSTLYSIAAELNVSLDDLLFMDGRRGSLNGTANLGGASPAPASAPGGPVQRAADRKKIRLASGVVWERLTTRSETGAEFLHVVYEVGGASSPSV
jgi:transcriptional regulator with XRE-family HTH domain